MIASVLLVDDDEPSRYLAQRALEPLGHRILVAETGEEALRHAAREHFAVILLDIGLPGTSGLDVAHELRQRGLNTQTPLIFVTGRSYTDALVSMAYATGAADLLFKPFHPDVVCTKVRVFVDLYLQRQHLAAQHAELLARTRALEDARLERRLEQEERERLETLLSQAPVAIAILRGPQHRIALANPPMCRVWGRQREEVLGRPHFEIFPETAGQGVEEMIDGVRTTGVPHSVRELRVPLARLEGGAVEEAWFNSVFEPLRDATGHIEGVIVVCAEVTEQVRARRRAEGLLAELEATFESIPDAAYVGDLARIKCANRQALEVLGFGNLEEFNQRLREMPSRANVRRADTGAPVPLEETGFVRALAGEAGTREYLMHNATTHRDIRVRSAANPVRLAGQVVAAVVVNTDITEQREAEAALRRSEAEFRGLAESLPQMVWTASPEGALTYVNSVMTRYSGLPAEVLLGTGYRGLLHPEDVGRSTERWGECVRTGEPFENEERWRRHDGTWRWHLVRAVALRDTEGRPARWVGSGTDVHDLRQSQAELQRRMDFEQQLIGIVSHDLRNPLSAILLGATTLARRETLDARSLQSVLRMQSSAERATRMIRDLLDFTRARLGGGLPIERRRVDLHLVTRGVLEEVEATNPGRTVELRCTGNGQGEWDADRVAQVVQNLVTNALKYSPADTHVRVETRGEEGHVSLSVHNLGPPLPAERREHLFEPMQRASHEVDTADRSVGLGLYIVDQIVRAHGGEVTVRSSAEEGTTFVVRLPRAPAAP